jgi:hypothetical protein
VNIISIRANPMAFAKALAAIAFLLVLASIGGQLCKYGLKSAARDGLINLLYVNAEGNLPTLFSVLLLFCAAVLLIAITVLEKNQKRPDASRWALLAISFLCLTIDEACSFHEKLSQPVRWIFGNRLHDSFYFAWVIPGLGLVCFLALFFLKFLGRLAARTRRLFLAAATCYIGGAIVIEIAGGHYAKLHGIHNLTYSMIATVEESLEMAGIIVFIYALLKYIAHHYQVVQFQFDGGK